MHETICVLPSGLRAPLMVRLWDLPRSTKVVRLLLALGGISVHEREAGRCR